MSSTAGQVITCKAAVAWGPNQPLCKSIHVVFILAIEQVHVAPPQV